MPKHRTITSHPDLRLGRKHKANGAIGPQINPPSRCGTWTNQITPWKAPTQAFTGGVWIVGSEVAAGTWRNSTSVDGCYWARLSGFGGSDIIENEFTFDPSIVTISASDTGFETEGCGTWTYVGP